MSHPHKRMMGHGDQVLWIKKKSQYLNPQNITTYLQTSMGSHLIKLQQ